MSFSVVVDPRGGVGVDGQGNLMYKRRKAYKRTVFNFVLQFILTCIMKRRT